MRTREEQRAWMLDQLAKSELFHSKLHEWGMLEMANQIDEIKGETLEWDLNKLGISQKAWERVIHNGIKPVIIFAHSGILNCIPRSVTYYRMLAMVSQKSMSRVGLPVNRYEKGDKTPEGEISLAIAKHLNKLISRLVEADEKIDAREFDLWRGMAAGSQAQGSWQNAKGERVEILVKSVLEQRIRQSGLIISENRSGGHRMELKDERLFIFADEPDVAVYKGGKIEAAIEIKGGIDPAGVLERIGAAVKSLRRAKQQNSQSVTVLIMQGVSMTAQAERNVKANKDVIDHLYRVEEILEDKEKQEELFHLLQI